MNAEYQKGKQALSYYHNAMIRYGKSLYPFSIDSLISSLTSRPFQKNFVEGLGSAIILAETSMSNVASGMETLARKGGGNIPANNNSFYQAIANDVRDNISYVSAASFVVAESAKDVINGAQAVGDKLILTGKILTFFLPVLVIGGLLIFLNEKSGGAIVKTVKGLKK